MNVNKQLLWIHLEYSLQQGNNAKAHHKITLNEIHFQERIPSKRVVSSYDVCDFIERYFGM